MIRRTSSPKLLRFDVLADRGSAAERRRFFWSGLPACKVDGTLSLSRVRASSTPDATKRKSWGGDMSFDGHLDEAGESVLHGWAHSSAIPELTIHVDIVINGRLVGRARAGNFR